MKIAALVPVLMNVREMGFVPRASALAPLDGLEKIVQSKRVSEIAEKRENVWMGLVNVIQAFLVLIAESRHVSRHV